MTSGSLNILLVSESETLFSEVQACLQNDSSPSLLTHVRSLSELSAHCARFPFEIVLLDGNSTGLPVKNILECALHFNFKCQTYLICQALDEESIAEALHLGATSFIMRDNLHCLPERLHLQQPLHTTGASHVPYPMNAHQILNAFLNESTDSIWVKNKHAKYLLINPAGARFLGKPIDQIIGKTDHDVFPPDTAQKVIKSDQAIIASGTTQTIEDLLMTLDGVNRTFQAVKGVFRDEQGEIQGVIGTVRDISYRKQAEEALRLSEQRFRLLVEGVKDHAFYMLDPQGYVTTWNIGAQRLQGYLTEEIIGKHFSCFYHSDEQGIPYPNKALELAIKLGSYEEETWYLRKGGVRYWADSIITPLYGEEQCLLGFSCVVRDMSHRRKAEDELRYYAAKLEQSNRDLEQFAFIASHDLQAPLRKIKIFAEMLQELAGEEGRDTAKRLQGAVIKMQQFISDLLTLSRINRRGNPFRMVPLSQIVASTLDDLELSIRDEQARIELGTLGTVYGDEAQLTQLFANLLSNSLKFKQANIPPTIKIKGEKLLNGFYQVTVQDNGIGFKEQYLERIFRPFERLHGESQFSGTGMGLAICQKIMERHGGQITAVSQEGAGATFILYLPTQPQGTTQITSHFAPEGSAISLHS